MDSTQSHWTPRNGWSGGGPTPLADADLVLVFGERTLLQAGDLLDEVRAAYPGAHLLGCSTAGEILDTRVRDGSLGVTAIRFETTQVRAAHVCVDAHEGDSRAVGLALAAELSDEDLAHVFVLSDGTNVNGSTLVEGLASGLPENTSVTGGLAGDGADFGTTLVVAGEETAANRVAAIGLYGRDLRVGTASLGGWDSFGPLRKVTRSEGNVLFELDGKPALDLYKNYLGEHADELPASGLLFPLAIWTTDHSEPVVRTILAIDEEARSLTFAGDVPEGLTARLMRANFDRLVDGAYEAARSSASVVGAGDVDLAILISCVGRKMVLRQRVDDEVEAVREVVGPHAALLGFYSYGEISPFTPDARCELHNQTMTVTTFSERRAA